ncbi:MAG: hypothetical protein LBN93_08140 [Candidatus Symbiothrix sp.]|jgi:hypothetical protein|nr:hypothetical protein [Candidatus Symbiothrix sp.]
MQKYTHTFIFWLLVTGNCLLVFVGCQPKAAKSGDVLVQVGDKVLTKEELQENIRTASTPEDSMLFAENYIQLWVNNQLLYDVARKNTTKDDETEISQLVDNYKKSLTIYRYQEQLVNEKLAKEISDEALEQFYAEHKDLFKDVLPDDSASFDYLKPTVREMVINRQKMEFLKKVEDDLYNKALKNGTVVFYNN